MNKGVFILVKIVEHFSNIFLSKISDQLLSYGQKNTLQTS